MCVMPLRVLLICIIALLGLPVTGSADNNVEIVQKKGLLLFQGFDHWLNTTYQYGGHESNHSGSGNSSHTTTETYNFASYASIVDPQMFRFSLSGSVGLQQVLNEGGSAGSSYGSGSKYQYNFNGTALEQSRFPLVLQSSRILDTVTPPFASTYTTDTLVNSAELSLLHDFLPLKFRFERDTTDVNSSNSVSDSTSNSFLISGIHKIGDVSSTSFAVNLSNTETRSTGTVSENNQNNGMFSANLANTLLLGAKRNHTLITSVLWKEENPSGVQQQIGSLNGSLLSRFGKALDTQLSYLGNLTRTTSVTGVKQELNSSSINGSLHHHLFQSLDTRLRGIYVQTLTLGGRETRYSGLVSLSYHKILPAKSRLTFDVSGEHAITDRNLATTDFSYIKEAHTVDQQGDYIALNNNENPLLSIDGVVSVNNGITTVYVEGVDYTVDKNLGRIQIIPGGGIAPGTQILISYTVRYDASIKYATDTISLSSSVSLLEGKYTLSGTLTNQGQSLISGQSQNSLRNTRVAQLRFKGVYLPDQTYSAIYEDFYSSRSSYRFLEGLWQYKHQFPRVSLFLQAKERYTIYDPIGTEAGNTQLSSNASLSFGRPIGQIIQMSMSLDLTDLQDGKSGRTDLVYFRSNLFARFNKLTVTLSGQSSWRFYGSLLTRDDYLRLDVTRYF